MRYRNPELPVLETPEEEGREFLILLSAVAALLAVLVGGSVLLAGWFAPRIPFAAERSIAAVVAPSFPSEGSETPGRRAVQAELEALVSRLAGVMDLPPGMSVTVHYVDAPTVNAMATLGGHLFVFRGLIAKLRSEEALAAVIAHEIGHVRERHVIRAMGRGVAIVTALNGLGIKSRGLSQWVLGETGQLAALTFSREAEREADEAALEASQRLYGHVGGVVDLFAFFAGQAPGGLEILKTHPLPATRAAALRQSAAERGYATNGARHPLPPALAALASTPAPDPR